MLDKLLDKTRSVLYGFSCIAMMIMLVTIFAQVITRYGFSYTPNRYKGTAFGKFLAALSLFCGYLFVLILLVQGAKMTEVMTFQESPGLGISMSYVYAVIPVSAVLMMLYLIRDTLRIFRGQNIDHQEIHE